MLKEIALAADVENDLEWHRGDVSDAASREEGEEDSGHQRWSLGLRCPPPPPGRATDSADARMEPSCQTAGESAATCTSRAGLS